MPDEDICPRCGNDVRMRSPQKSQGNSFSSNPGGRAGKSAQQNDWSSVGDTSNAIFNVFPPANDFSSGKGTEEKASQSGTMKGGSAPVGPTQNYASRSDRKQGTSSRKREKPGASHSGSKAGNPQKTSPGTAPDRAIFDVFPPAFGGEAPETGVRGEPSFKAGPQVSQAPGQPPQGQGGAPFVAGPQEEKPFNADPQGGMPFSNTPQGGWTPGQTQQGPFGAGPQDSQPSQGQGGTPFGAGPQGSQPSQGQGERPVSAGPQGSQPSQGQGGAPFGAGPQGSQPSQGQGGAPFGAGPQEEKPFNADPQGGMPFNTTPQDGRAQGQTPQGGPPFGADPRGGAGTNSVRQNDSYQDDPQSRMTGQRAASTTSHEEVSSGPAAAPKKEVTIDQNTWNGWMMSNISLNERIKSGKQANPSKRSIFSGLFGGKKS